jgi:hypothetical protein
VGLYLNPPQQALVLCVDEKSQIQALDRTQPGLPIKKGRCGTMTHDYKTQRHHHPVRRSGDTPRKGRRRMPSETPASGVSAVPAPARRRVPRRCPITSDHGQLWNTQTRESEGMAETLSPFRVSLCPHQLQLDESGRAMVRPLRQQGHPTRRLPQCGRPAGVHPIVSHGLESASQTLPMDRDRRIHPGKAHPLPTNLGVDPARLHQPQVQKTAKVTA